MQVFVLLFENLIFFKKTTTMARILRFTLKIRFLMAVKLNHFLFLAICTAVLLPQISSAQVSGTVFRDYNSNGVKDNTPTFNEPFVKDVTITAYDASGAVVGTTTSDGSGAYSFTGLTLPLRIEFSDYANSDYSTVNGSTNKTSVQFYTAATTTADFGINYPSDYNTGKENAVLATPNYVNGSPLGGGTSGQDDGFIIWNYTNYGNSMPTDPGYKSIPFSSLGTTWGVALDKQKQKLYTSAFIKRHSGLGSSGLGAIYAIDYNAATPTPTLLTDVTSYPGVNIGSLNRVPSVGAVDDPNELSVNKIDPSWDVEAFAKVGKEGLGGLTISDDNSKLYVVNLFQRNIIEINLSPLGVASFSKTIPINDPGAANGDYRPWGIKYHKGRLYVGIVGTAQTSQQATDLYAYLVQIDPATTTNSTQYNFPINFRRGAAGGCCGNEGYYWQPWTDTYANISTNPSTFWIYPQPIFSDIEFDVDGSVILGFMDRLGHQGGLANYLPNYPNTTIATSVHNSGDIIRLCNVNGTLQLENNGTYPGEVRPKNLGDGSFNSGADNNQGPGGGEFYWGDFYNFQPYSQGANMESHQEIGFGGLALLEGSGEVIMTGMDPTESANSAGIIKLNNSNGRQATPLSGNYSGYRLYESLSISDGFGKAIGLGDVEAISSLPPLEIGNRVWSDTDSDGIQDADEAGIDNITVQLYEGTTLVGTTTTANGGQWFFNTSNITGGVKPNTAYIVRVQSASFPTGQSLTGTNTDGTTNGDVRDNDATLVGGNAEIAYTTGNYGENNHTLDIGFRAACSLSATATGTNVNCNAGSDGTALATASGNAGAVTYLWSNNETSAAISGLVADSYTVTITETPTCTAIASYQVSEPNLLSVNCTHTDVTTNGGSDGTANVSVTGGTLPYLYLWSSNETAASISAKTADTYTVTVTDFNGCTAICSRTINEPAAPNPDLSLTKTVSNAIATLNGTVTYTLTLTNDNGIDATGVVVTDYLPNGVTFVSSSAPANVNVSGNTVTWNVGNFLGSDTPKTLQITVTADSEGMFINNTEITAMNETDDDSTPNNNLMGEDDQDQACFSVPIVLCSDNPSATISIVGINAASYQWYVSADNGTTYTALSGETNQTLVVNNTLTGGNGITKYFKVAYNGADITGACGEVMCCPVIINTQSCIVCPPQRCLTVIVTKN